MRAPIPIVAIGALVLNREPPRISYRLCRPSLDDFPKRSSPVAKSYNDRPRRCFRPLAAGELTAIIIILGDMNVLPGSPALHLATLLNGDISDEKTFGPDFKMDWDGTDLAQVKPSHNSLGDNYYTWRRDDEPFAPAALDRIIYTDSVLSLNHSFVLNTMIMTPGDLNGAGLLMTDVLWNGEPGIYDHMPVVADFSIHSIVDAARPDILQ